VKTDVHFVPGNKIGEVQSALSPVNNSDDTIVELFMNHHPCSPRYLKTQKMGRFSCIMC